MYTKFRKIREDYQKGQLCSKQMSDEPFEEFQHWLEKAISSNATIANSMVLSTADAGGQASARVVLLKDFDRQGFVFFTNYESRKAKSLDVNPVASLLFWWPKLERQIAIEGKVEKVSSKESDTYFRSRPKESNYSAIASPQSRMVESRGELEMAVDRVKKKWEGKEIKRPCYWGGFRLSPVRFEFWQGREDRLHDRILFQLEGEEWRKVRIAP